MSIEKSHGMRRPTHPRLADTLGSPPRTADERPADHDGSGRFTPSNGAAKSRGAKQLVSRLVPRRARPLFDDLVTDAKSRRADSIRVRREAAAIAVATLAAGDLAERLEEASITRDDRDRLEERRDAALERASRAQVRFDAWLAEDAGREERASSSPSWFSRLFGASTPTDDDDSDADESADDGDTAHDSAPSPFRAGDRDPRPGLDSGGDGADLSRHEDREDHYVPRLGPTGSEGDTRGAPSPVAARDFGHVSPSDLSAFGLSPPKPPDLPFAVDASTNIPAAIEAEIQRRANANKARLRRADIAGEPPTGIEPTLTPDQIAHIYSRAVAAQVAAQNKSRTK